MNKESVDSFIASLNWGKELKFAEAIAAKRLSTFRKDECNSKGNEAHDIAVGVISKFLDDPALLLKESDLGVRNFRARIRGEINNAVKLIVKSKEVRTTASYSYNEVLSDEAFFDYVIQTPSTAEAELNSKQAVTAYFDQVGEKLLAKPDEQAWLILEELRDGKKPQEIVEGNNLTIEKVYSAIKRIHRAAQQVKEPELYV
ncbi:hypothetical protein VF13_41355 [Nostoc linckia z16]|jgi:hypothetical protein|nr:hypothetical protein [uncultured Arsenicibacter sp.]PHK17580.1 hypothetical protein VF12_39665 [Nostoc linckia z15]PHK27654.1 hypothetical protein VF13_41355 [Nostoc linckia z16]